MSSTSSKTASKPKRSLSGYNLFYRYKRIKVLEAIAHPTNGNGRHDEAVIREVLSILPGLEGVSPNSPIFDSSPAHVNEFRATSIRTVMEGKLFPNENGRQRLHRKIHGVGFVEMGRVMRQLWGRADTFTKGVFCELAEVGRVRYKKFAAEYKLRCEIERAKGDAMELAEGSAETCMSEKSMQGTPDAKKLGTVGLVVKSVVTPSPVDEIDLMTVEALARTAKTRPISNRSQNSKVEPAPAAKSTANRALADDGATVPVKAEREAKPAKSLFVPQRHSPSSVSMFEDHSSWATKNPPPAPAAAGSVDHNPESGSQAGYGYRRQVSIEIDFASAAMANTFATSAPSGGKTQPNYRRMVSREQCFNPLTIDTAAGSDAKYAFESLTVVTNDARPEKHLGPTDAETRTGDVHRRRASADALPPREGAAGGAIGPPAAGAKTIVWPRSGGRAFAATGPHRRGDSFRPPGEVLLEGTDLPARSPVGTDDVAGVPKFTASGGMQERRVSPDVCPVAHGGTGGAVATGNGSSGSGSSDNNHQGLKVNLEMQQILLQNEIERMKGEIIRKNSLLPPEMRVSTQYYMTSLSSSDSLALSGSGGIGYNIGGDDVSMDEAYTQDFMKMISTLGEAIDDHTLLGSS